jgi:thioredoxin reductase (NADPH)
LARDHLHPAAELGQDSYRVTVLSDGAEISSKAVLIATGARFRRLELPGIQDLIGAGVYYGAAYTEAMNYQDQPVLVVGGANSAGQGAMYLSRCQQGDAGDPQSFRPDHASGT